MPSQTYFSTECEDIVRLIQRNLKVVGVKGNIARDQTNENVPYHEVEEASWLPSFTSQNASEVYCFCEMLIRFFNTLLLYS